MAQALKDSGDLKKSYQELNKGIDLKACQSIGKQFTAVAELDRIRTLKRTQIKLLKRWLKKNVTYFPWGK